MATKSKQASERSRRRRPAESAGRTLPCPSIAPNKSIHKIMGTCWNTLAASTSMGATRNGRETRDGEQWRNGFPWIRMQVGSCQPNSTAPRTMFIVRIKFSLITFSSPQEQAALIYYLDFSSLLQCLLHRISFILSGCRGRGFCGFSPER